MTNELKLMFLLAVEVLFVSALSIQGARMRDAALGGGRISRGEIFIIICVMVAFFFLGVLARRYQSVAGLWALCLIVAVLGTVIDALEGKHSRLALIGGLVAVLLPSILGSYVGKYVIYGKKFESRKLVVVSLVQLVMALLLVWIVPTVLK